MMPRCLINHGLNVADLASENCSFQSAIQAIGSPPNHSMAIALGEGAVNRHHPFICVIPT
jgi:hypothetical protein